MVHMAAGEDLDIEAWITALAAVDEDDILRLGVRQLALDAARLVNAASAFAALTNDALDRSHEWAAGGATSAAQWLAARTGSAPRVHRGRIRDGRALRLLPSLAVPARAGTLSAEHVRSASACVAKHPELAVEDEAALVNRALELDAPAYAIVTRRWIEQADKAAELPGSAPEPQSELCHSTTADGCGELEGTFAPDDNAILEAGIQAGFDRLLRAARDGDPALAGKPASALRAMALVELVAQSMRREPSERSAPDRYRVAVVVPHDVAGEPPMATCDATMFRVVLNADSEVLDVGRDTPRWPRGIRRAVTIRDQGCVFPGCDRPPGHCDIHHCRPWEHGGETKIDNGALLCRSHHTFLHKEKWTIQFHGRRPQVHQPDGSLFTITPWRSDTPDDLSTGGGRGSISECGAQGGASLSADAPPGAAAEAA